MSKLTFRADEELIQRVEALDASKSDIMREALRSYLETHDGVETNGASRPSETGEQVAVQGLDRQGDRDINVNITIDRQPPSTPDDPENHSDPELTRPTKSTPPSGSNPCGQCGEPVAPDHVYCPNCGEKQSRRVFCDCGDEIRSDWSFCPGCGRRTPAADVLDGS